MNTPTIICKLFYTLWVIISTYFTLIGWLLDYYPMVIWWLFDDYCVYLSYLKNSKIPVKICKVNDSHNFAFARLCCQCIKNTGDQACKSSEGNIWFAWFITANCPPHISMSAVRIIRTWGCKFTITVFAWKGMGLGLGRSIRKQNAAKLAIAKFAAN